MLVLLALACAEAPAPAAPAAPPAAPAPAAAPAPDAAAPTALGEPFDDTNLVPVDTLVSASAEWNGKDVVVDGTVKEVCQKKGCWHTIATADPNVSLMVKDKEYKIFLPKDSAGKRVHVKGTFAVEDIPEAEARHYAEDAGRDPSTVTGPQHSYSLDVSGVRFVES